MRFGKPQIALESCASTQDSARQFLAQPGAVVTAQSMTAGRGRLGRRWTAPVGANIAFTAVGEPVAPERLWELAPLVGLAVAEAVRRFGFDARIRFPNDIFLSHRKLGGVLIEAQNNTPLIGVGVNVLPRVWPQELEGIAIALEAGPSVQVLQEVIWECLTERWMGWQQEGLYAALPDWHALLDPEARRIFVLEGQPTLCKVALLSASGHVTLELPNGSLCTILASEVIFGED
ncbi:biotin--[acetyl-CoA-carboxylase] ligase [Armatimonas sp.]|uniref:biotin--[acetyl-CoA-carboxylase] ligase n=1 Tax=Armatimonas sp. TaxID=1872638 RepID=UPI003752A2DB